MKAENKTTPHNRTLRITDIPPIRLNNTRLGRLSSMSIVLDYTEDDGQMKLDKGITLDNVIIPAIIRALNSLSEVEVINAAREKQGGC